MMLRLTALLFVSALVCAGCSYDLEHHLDEKDANEIYALLARNGINAKKGLEEGGNEPTYLITVAKTDAAQASDLLREHALPRPKSPGLHGITASKGMIPTEVEQRAEFLEALAGEITTALNKFDGVLESHAVVNLPQDNDLTPEKRAANTASVFVKYRPTLEGKPPLDEAHLKAFVANALPETRPENVTVILSQAQLSSAELNEASQMKSVLGMQMTAASVAQFRWVVGVMGMAMLAMLGLTAYMFLRGTPAPTSRSRRM